MTVIKPKPRMPPKATSEKMLQVHAVSEIRKIQRQLSPDWTPRDGKTPPVGSPAFLFAGSMEGAARGAGTAGWAKATGMVAGEPDLRLYGPSGSILFIELKTSTGRTSSVQDDRHVDLASLGHRVVVVHAVTGPEMAAGIRALVTDWYMAAVAMPPVAREGLGAVMGPMTHEGGS